MSSTGELSPGTAADDSSLASSTITWSNVNNAKASDANLATAQMSAIASHSVVDKSLRFYDGVGAAYSGDEKADTATTWPATVTAATYGSATDKWSVALTRAMMVNANTGFSVSAKDTTLLSFTHYLKVTNFNPSLVSTAIIDGLTTKVYRSVSGEIGSFIGGTMVPTPNGLRPIQDIKIGDWVLSFFRGKIYPSQVIGLRTGFRPTVTLIAEGETGKAEVTATIDHLFYMGKGKWKKAFFLKEGDTIYVLKDGSLVPVKVVFRGLFSEREIFTLEVEKYHNFFANGFAVHNAAVGSTIANVDWMTANIAYHAANTQTFTETVTVSDSQARAFTDTKTDAITVADSLLKAPARAFAEAVTVADSMIKGAGKTFLETVATAEAFTRAATRSFLDTVSLVEAFIKAPVRLFTDLVQITDVNTTYDAAYGGVAFGASPYAGGVDALYFYWQLNRTLLETVSLSETLTTTQTRTLLDAITVADSLLKGSTRSLVDAISVADSIIKAPVKLLADLASVSDRVIKAITRSLSDSTTVSDRITRDRFRTLTDSVTLTDKGIVRVFGRVFLDVVIITECYVALLDGFTALWGKISKPVIEWIKQPEPNGVIEGNAPRVTFGSFGYGVTAYGMGIPRVALDFLTKIAKPTIEYVLGAKPSGQTITASGGVTYGSRGFGMTAYGMGVPLINSGVIYTNTEKPTITWDKEESPFGIC